MNKTTGIAISVTIMFLLGWAFGFYVEKEMHRIEMLNNYCKSSNQEYVIIGKDGFCRDGNTLKKIKWIEGEVK